MRKLLLVRPFANIMNIQSYNSQEIGLCKAFCKYGYDCDIVYFSRVNRSEKVFCNGKNKVTLIWKKGITIGTMAIFPEYLNPLRLKTYDIIISNEYNQIMSIFLTLLHRNVYIYHGPYFNTFEMDVQMKVYDWINVPICNRFVKGIFAKTDDAAYFLRKKGLKNVICVGVGLDIEKFEKRQLDFMDLLRTNNILYVGTDEPRKRIGYIMKVFQALCEKKKEVHLTIVGNIDRNRKIQLMKMVSPQYRQNIEFLGRVHNTMMADIYGNALCSVLASDEEIFGMVVLESMYFGVPCIANAVAGPKTVIDDQINGILENNYDIERWAADIEYLINHSEKRIQMGNEAKRKVLHHFTWDKIAYKMMKKMKER